jgi:hypothetical protein
MSPEEGSREYEENLNRYFASSGASAFDLVILGLGEDAMQLRSSLNHHPFQREKIRCRCLCRKASELEDNTHRLCSEQQLKHTFSGDKSEKGTHPKRDSRVQWAQPEVSCRSDTPCCRRSHMADRKRGSSLLDFAALEDFGILKGPDG